MNFNIGDKVTWMAVNGPVSGVIEQFGNGYAIIRLANNKVVPVSINSLKQ